MLFVLLLGGPSGPIGLAHLGLRDDPACEVRVEARDAHGVLVDADADAGSPGPVHCATCHWLYSLRWSPPPAAAVVFVASVLTSVLPALDAPPLARVALTLAARAPPSCLHRQHA